MGTNECEHRSIQRQVTGRIAEHFSTWMEANPTQLDVSLLTSLIMSARVKNRLACRGSGSGSLAGRRRVSTSATPTNSTRVGTWDISLAG